MKSNFGIDIFDYEGHNAILVGLDDETSTKKGFNCSLSMI
jgi:hypothetical protein